MDGKKLLRDNQEIRDLTRALISQTGVTRSAALAGVQKSAISAFLNKKQDMSIERVVVVYEALRSR